MKSYSELLTTALKDNQLTLQETEQLKLAQYLDLLQTWNHAFNLTSITEPREMVYLHIIDSLLAAPFLHSKRLLDVGSGAGLPGIPLAITHSDQHWVLLDKNGKKTRFITQAIAELELKNVQAVYQRCEDFQPDTGFDSIVSRAFGTIRMFVETTEHLLNPDGLFIAMKGKYPEEELAELPSRFLVRNVTRLSMNGVEGERHIVQIGRKE
jgi:16S rRNA (guanine527-N7)-methyltransferase